MDKPTFVAENPIFREHIFTNFLGSEKEENI